MTVIHTYSGQQIDLLEPDKAVVLGVDIAHALSHLCRFTGHSDRFYSVGMHSLLVSQLVPEEYALEALLHDASEAYLGDVSAPLKSALPDYRRIEDAWQEELRNVFGLPERQSHWTSYYDRVACWLESAWYMTEPFLEAIIMREESPELFEQERYDVPFNEPPVVVAGKFLARLADLLPEENFDVIIGKRKVRNPSLRNLA